MSTLTAGTPVWLHETPVAALPHFPRLRGHVETDIVVVGGGITGSTVAALFAEAGVGVCLLEGANVAQGSTAASTALLLQEPDKGLLELQELYGTRAGRRIWRVSHDAARGLAQTLQRFRIACDLRARDSIYYTTQHAAVAGLRAEFEARRQAGFAGTWLSAGALRRATAVAGPAGIRTTGNAQLDPLKASLGL
ncbi:MAG TPA: FAD-dependent oxidoreductase, partial [Luteitalea sp.]|nr:FAD-dependent oxidoreductase [Luteitalea sp.]